MKGNDVVLYHLPGVTYVKNITKPLMTKKLHRLLPADALAQDYKLMNAVRNLVLY